MKKATKFLMGLFGFLFVLNSFSYAQITTASDSAGNSGYSGSWGDGDTGGFGFDAWSNTYGSNTGTFIGSPANNGMGTTGIGTTAFGLYSTDGSGYTNAVRYFDNGMQVGDTLSFYWAINWDAFNGNKGFDLRSGGTTIINVNNAGSATISITDGTVSTDYGTEPMFVQLIRTSSSNYDISITERDGSGTFTDSFTSSSSIDNINIYIGGQGDSEGNRNMYFNHFAINGKANLSITGSEGWRILSSPTSDNSYDDLLGGLWTQGIATGADATNGTANVQTYDGSSFSAVSDLTATMPTAGYGFIAYIYSDDDYDGNAEGFPKTLSLSGTENSGDVSPTLTSGADNWTLVGNPYASTVDADNFTYNEVESVVYVYDHSYGSPSSPDTAASGSAGSYRVWNGAAGSLTDGLITPFQGFWVQNSSSVTSPSLTIQEADKSSGGTFYKALKTPVVELKLEQDSRYSTTYFSFTPGGELNKDSRDALKLLPLDHADYVSISSLVEGVEMDINNLPGELEEDLEIALNIKSFDAVETGWAEKSGEFTISWPKFENIPDDWNVTLVDHKTGQSVDLRNEDSYTFQVTEVSENIIEKSAFSMLSPVTVTKQKGAYEDRFVIVIKPDFSIVDIEEGTSPEVFTLSQNYPNPFNPSTNIRYSVADAGDVTLSVFNLMGQKVAELVNENKAAGTYSVTWNASGMASGMYYYRLASAGQTITRKMTLIK